MANEVPFVALACFCENVLQDKDEVVSAIRIVDTYTIPPLPEGVEVPADAVRGLIMLRGLVALKAGDVVGQGTVRLVMQRVNGERAPIGPPDGWPVEMKGGEHGVNLHLQIPLGVKNFGLLWFDVFWNETLLTRIPLRLRQGQTAEQANAPT